MRRKRNCLDVVSWRMHKVELCTFCDKKAEYHMRVVTFPWIANVDLCGEHRLLWEKGDLYI